MFLRSVKAANGRHEYLRLVENYREGDRVRQRVVVHVGRKDLLAPHLDALVRLLQADQPAPAWVCAEQVSAPQAWTWGPLRVARLLFDSLSLGPILDDGRPSLRHGQPLSEEEQHLTSVEAVMAYKQLNEVERGFAHLKGLLEVRPVHHRKEERVRAHVFVAALGFLLDRALEKKLRAAGNCAVRFRGGGRPNQAVRDPRQPACDRGAEDSQVVGVRPAPASRGPGDGYVVTKMDSRLPVSNHLRGQNANMR